MIDVYCTGTEVMKVKLVSISIIYIVWSSHIKCTTRCLPEAIISGNFVLRQPGFEKLPGSKQTYNLIMAQCIII